MTATLEQRTNTGRDFAQELSEDVVAIRLAISQFGRRRQMTNEQKAEVADHFQADHNYVSGSKRLFPVKRPELKAITSAIGAVKRMWESFTIALAGVDGVRLIRKDQLEKFIETFDLLEGKLNDALAEADGPGGDNYVEIVREARQALGERLFDVRDYPNQLQGSVKVRWSTYNFRPDEELLRLAPQTYQREQLRVRKQFEASVAIYEAECKAEMSKMVQALIDKLTPSDDGKPKKFTEAATTNLREFFDRFENLGVFSDADMAKLIGEAKSALGGTTMADLKRNTLKQREIKQAFEEIKTGLDAMVIDRPERSIDLDDLED